MALLHARHSYSRYAVRHLHILVICRHMLAVGPLMSILDSHVHHTLRLKVDQHAPSHGRHGGDRLVRNGDRRHCRYDDDCL